MEINRKRVARRLVSGLVAGALALGGLAISGGSVSAKTPSSPTTNRIAGDDRYETAVELARDTTEAQAANDMVKDGLVIVSGESPWDALSAAPLSTATRPMLLVRQNSVPESVLDFISDYRTKWLGGNDKFYFVGGESAVSAEVEATILAAAAIPGDTLPPKAVRLAGDSRYGTSKAVAGSALVTQAGDKAILVNGNSWADAVSAGVMSAYNGWPIILTPGSVTGDSKTAIDDYIAGPGSTAEFIIVGGPAVMPTSIDEYLVVEGVAPADIDRIGGADRYQTSLLVNVYLYNYDSAFSGTNIALVSGENPWDALAAAGWAANKAASPNVVHVQLTTAAGGNAFVSTLSGTLSTLASANGALTGRNGTLYIVGGKSAVADSAKAAYVAASASDLSTTLVCPAEGSKSLVIAYSGALSAAEQARATSAIMAGQVKKNGTALVDGTTSLAVTKLSSTTYLMTLSAAAAEDDEFKLATDAEGANYTVLARTAVGSSCTVSEDTTDPVVTMRAVAGTLTAPATTAAQHLILSASEPLNIGASLAIGAVTVNGLANAKVAPATKLDAAGTKWLVTIDPSDGAIVATLAAGKVVTVDNAALPDLAGNTPAFDVTTTSATDSSAAVLSVSSVTCIQGSGFATMTKGDLTVTAKSSSTLGAAGNEYSLAVVNQRGLLIPTVSVSAETKVITVTADVNYHTPQDVATAARNSLVEDALLGTWVFTDNGGTAGLVATTTNAISTAGTSDCTVEVSSNEPVGLEGADVTIAGFGAVVTGETVSDALGAAWAGTNDAAQFSFDLDFTTTLLGSGAISWTGAKNGAGVATVAGLTFTAG